MISSELMHLMAEIDSILVRDFNKSLFNPKFDDQCRLVRLRLWSFKYKVEISYILSVLIPHFERMTNKHRGRARQSIGKGIGTTIAILTGKVSESILQEQITKDFPEGDNLVSWRMARQQECLNKLAKDDIAISKPKSMLEYDTLAEYYKAYLRRITHDRDTENKVARRLAKQPWRANPFR